jgi:uncharacterized secreted protein with C-terminal beta-propeller domain|tara:strand:+ start:130 stop:543 length:414 start_codon:yes stop_codon:yes gene_type:complete
VLVRKKNEEVTHRNRPDQEHNKQNRQSVNWERKNKGLTPNKAKQLAKLKDELEVQKNVELQRLQKTENLLSGLRNDDVWVDWIKDYGKKVKILNKLDRNARNAEILKYVDKIRVSFNENKRTHKLNIKLELPILTTP